MSERVCVECGEDISGLHGLRKKCKACAPPSTWYARMSEDERAAYKEQKRKAQRERWDTDPENRAQKRAYSRQYYKDNREKVQAYNREWRAANPDRVAGYLRERRKIAPNLSGAKRAKIPTQKYREQEGLCGLCGLPLILEECEIDHIVPASRAEELGLTRENYNHPSNMHITHRQCNLRKSKWIPTDPEYPQDFPKDIGVFKVMQDPLKVS